MTIVPAVDEAELAVQIEQLAVLLEAYQATHGRCCHKACWPCRFPDDRGQRL